MPGHRARRQDKRDCLIFLGAGASYPDGVPLQKDIVPEILNPRDERLKASPMNSELAKFIKKSFAYSDEEKIYPSLEVIFSYIEHFLINETALSEEYPLDKLAQIKDYLIKFIYHVTSKERAAGQPGPEGGHYGHGRESIYASFWEKVSSHPNVSIMTTNYDTQLDDAFDRRMQAKHGLIDYRVDFLNYPEGSFGEAGGRGGSLRSCARQADGVKPIKVIKLHGSLNWKYCACCNQALLTPCDTAIDLRTGDMRKVRDQEHGGSLDSSRCPIDDFPLSMLIVPPSYAKSLKHPVIQRLLIEAANELRAVKRVVFVGYSFPEADVHVRALFQKNLARDTPVHVINPLAGMESRLAFGSLADDVTFIEASFEETIRNGRLEGLLRPRVARRAAGNRPARAEKGPRAT